MEHIYVFHEFAQLEALQQLVGKVKRMSPLENYEVTSELSEIYATNIKIFFNGNADEAYRVKTVLEENSFATTVTDQLTKTLKDGRTILLPKDRIIMRLK